MISISELSGVVKFIEVKVEWWLLGAEENGELVLGGPHNFSSVGEEEVLETAGAHACATT